MSELEGAIAAGLALPVSVPQVEELRAIVEKAEEWEAKARSVLAETAAGDLPRYDLPFPPSHPNPPTRPIPAFLLAEKETSRGPACRDLLAQPSFSGCREKVQTRARHSRAHTQSTARVLRTHSHAWWTAHPSALRALTLAHALTATHTHSGEGAVSALEALQTRYLHLVYEGELIEAELPQLRELTQRLRAVERKLVRV